MFHHVNSTAAECTPIQYLNYSEAEDEIIELHLGQRRVYNVSVNQNSSNNHSAVDLNFVTFNDQQDIEESNRKIDEFIQLIESPKRTKFDGPIYNLSEFYEDNEFQINTPGSLNSFNPENDFLFDNAFEVANIFESLQEPIKTANKNHLETIKQLMLITGIENWYKHLKVLCRLPHSSSNVLPVSWSQVYTKSIGSRIRDFKKWNELKEKLIDEELLESRILNINGRNCTRFFRLFKSKEEADII